ncbi:hypothetical protein DQ04_03381050 [Trypanosoma grayi]|uniref:hypothetical protein n=1 Tax=Trypanosoma grayi TaxID=71804 RepID=UPI0004F4B9BE|nr:hypothetical protein DQ04_03381050 [Trypanosoma grayi]KEG10713.1 hypothetical protein DQ04_03381050 [Trypanosoma grayi]
MMMSSKKALAGNKPTTVSPSPAGSAKREEGDWRSTMKAFREEVQKLKEENEALKSTTVELANSWQMTAEKLESLKEEIYLSQKNVLNMLDEEWKKSADAAKERNDLLQRLGEAQEKCASANIEVSRLAGILEGERIKNSSAVAVHEKEWKAKEMKIQLELGLREKQLEETQRDMRQYLERYEASLAAKDKLLEEERAQWENQREKYEEEKYRLLMQTKKRGRPLRFSPELATESGAIMSNGSFLTPQFFNVVTEEDAARSVSKKSRLEEARQQRRQHEQHHDDVTLRKLDKLNDLKDRLRL